MVSRRAKVEREEEEPTTLAGVDRFVHAHFPGTSHTQWKTLAGRRKHVVVHFTRGAHAADIDGEGDTWKDAVADVERKRAAQKKAQKTKKEG